MVNDEVEEFWWERARHRRLRESRWALIQTSSSPKAPAMTSVSVDSEARTEQSPSVSQLLRSAKDKLQAIGSGGRFVFSDPNRG